MATINTISNEPERGCGFRKPGGLYLVAGFGAAPCGKLPLPLTVCPCCGAGIKFARGWTWISPAKLFDGVECRYAGDPDRIKCFGCPLDVPPERAGLIWIGEKFYKSAGAFTDEVAAQGISRRITSVPHDFKLGETWVLLAHRKAVEEVCPICEGSCQSDGERCFNCEGVGRLYTPGIFYVFRPEAIEYIVKGDESEEELDRMEKRGISLVKLVRRDLFSEEVEQEAISVN